MMDPTATHIIERITLDVRTDRGDYATQRAYGDWLRTTAVPAMGALCDEVIPAGERWRVDRLELDLGRFTRLDLNLPGQRAALLERLLAQLRATLSEQLAEARIRGATGGSVSFSSLEASERLVPVSSDRPLTAWLYFLEHGNLPWWAEPLPPAGEWSKLLVERLTAHGATVMRNRLRELIGRSSAAVRRLTDDPRHVLAFDAVVLYHAVLPTAWRRWLTAWVSMEPFSPKFAALSITKAGWVDGGKAYFWWAALGPEAVPEGVDALLLSALRTTVPNLGDWPAADRQRLAELLDLPPEKLAVGPRPVDVQPGHDEVATDPRQSTRRADQQPPDAETDYAAGTANGQPPAPATIPEFPTTHDNVQPTDAPPPGSGQGSTPGRAESDSSRMETDQEQSTELSAGQSAERNQSPGAVPEDIPPSLVPTDPVAGEAAEDDSSPVGTLGYLHHAGVVLAHPFLAPLFSALGYWQEEAFVDPLAQQRAVFLTHYLATGVRVGQEEEMALPKLLCGWPVSGAALRLTQPLTGPECHEADEVLRAVISHWTALGEASPEGLREGFFVREGRMARRENGWAITVERKAQDILLGKLPWGISLIQAPWHERMIKVDW